MLNKDQQNVVFEQIRAAGMPVSKGKPVRSKFTSVERLIAGIYTPMFNGPQPAILCPPRRKGGNSYEAIAFTSSMGQTVKIGLGSIFNSIKVVTNLEPSALVQGAKWAGEAAQPTRNYFRFGALSDMPSQEVLDPEDNTTIAFYWPSSFTLTTEVVYVAPRFVEGSGRPIFDEQCLLRKCFVVADYMAYIDTHA